MKIRVIKKKSELETVRNSWDNWQHHPNCDFKQFKLVCGLRSEVVGPYVYFVEHNDQPLTLMAARIENSYVIPTIGYFRPLKIPIKELVVLYQGLLGKLDGHIAKMLVQNLCDMLSQGEADMVSFHQLTEHSPLHKALLTIGRKGGLEPNPQWSIHREMSLPDQTGSLLKDMKSKHRSWIRGRQRKLESAYSGNVRWKWITQFDDLPGLWAQIEQVASLTYQRGLGAGFVDNEEHRLRYDLFARRGQLRVQVLEIEERVSAFWIGTVYRNVFYSSATGYDPELRVYEPGTLIFIHMIDELVREGVKKFDFGLGDAHYKERFGDNFWREATMRMYAPTLKGVAIKSLLGIFNLVDDTGRRVLKRFGILDKIKTMWRQRIAKTKTDRKKGD
jgi:hypothetical protein